MNNTLTSQEIFDTVLNHLRVQGEPSIQGDGCLYRGPNGTMCAVGCLIDDDEYSEGMEETSVGGLGEEGLLPERLVPHVELLASLQGVHDHNLLRGMEEFESGMRTIANSYDLTYTGPGE